MVGEAQFRTLQVGNCTVSEKKTGPRDVSMRLRESTSVTPTNTLRFFGPQDGLAALPPEGLKSRQNKILNFTLNGKGHGGHAFWPAPLTGSPDPAPTSVFARKTRGGKRGKSKGVHNDGLIASIVSAQQALELLQYYFLKELSRRNPENAEFAVESKEFGSAFMNTMFANRAEPAQLREDKLQFLKKLRHAAICFAQEKADAYMGHSAAMAKAEAEKSKALGQIQKQFESRVADLDSRKSEAIAGIGVSFKRTDDMLAEQLAKKGGPVWEKIKEKIKAWWPQAVVGIGAAISSFSKVFGEIKSIITDFTEHIPLLSSIPPEIIGLGMVGMGLFLKGVKTAMHHRDESKRISLPVMEPVAKDKESEKWESKKEEAMRQASEQCAATEEFFKAQINGLVQALESRQAETDAKMLGAYNSLLAHFEAGQLPQPQVAGKNSGAISSFAAMTPLW